MEVHHHSHTARKKWTHYLWEFLMLFLAVFCGFLAENQREHMIEQQREKKYIVSLLKDLELDVASLENTYKLQQVQYAYFDSLAFLLKKGYKGRLNDFYFYSRFIPRNNNFQYHDRTIQQLKNSGNLRLIRNTDAADSITVYDNEVVKLLLDQQNYENEFRKEISWKLIVKILDPIDWEQMSDSTGKINRYTTNPVLKTTDPGLLNEFHFWVIRLKGTIFFTNMNIQRATASARNLIFLLKKEYHIK